jgi:hypothetical protein
MLSHKRPGEKVNKEGAGGNDSVALLVNEDNSNSNGGSSTPKNSVAPASALSATAAKQPNLPVYLPEVV